MQSNNPVTASGMTLAGGMSPWLQPAPAGPAVTAVRRCVRASVARRQPLSIDLLTIQNCDFTQINHTDIIRLIIIRRHTFYDISVICMMSRAPPS